MKTSLLIITTLALGALSVSADELSWVDEQVAAIKPPRSGLSSREIASVRNPFIYIRKKAPKSATSSSAHTTSTTSVRPVAKKSASALVLTTVINKSVLISGQWYKQGDNVEGYKIEKVMPQTVLLTKHNKKIVLTTNTSSTKLKFKN